jgi:hypothetical protein
VAVVIVHHQEHGAAGSACLLDRRDENLPGSQARTAAREDWCALPRGTPLSSAASAIRWKPRHSVAFREPWRMPTPVSRKADASHADDSRTSETFGLELDSCATRVCSWRDASARPGLTAALGGDALSRAHGSW